MTLPNVNVPAQWYHQIKERKTLITTTIFITLSTKVSALAQTAMKSIIARLVM